MIKSLKYVARALIFIFFIVFTFMDRQVLADGETAAFGSESYGWELNTSSLIGVYARSNQSIDTVRMNVVYDAEMMEYQSGGELIEPGLVKVSASGVGGTEYKEMLSFIPRIAGVTTITVQELHIRSTDGEENEAEAANAMITIPIPEGCALEGILLNGAGIEGFDSTQTSYNIEVADVITQAELTVLPSEVQTEISDTTLVVGNNAIFITTTNGNGQKARYTLNINRPESADQVEEQDEGPEQVEPAVILEGSDTAAKRNQLIFVAVMVILVLLLFSLIILKINLMRKNKEEQNRQERKRRLEARRALEAKNRREEKADETIVSQAPKNSKDKREVEIAVNHITMEFKREKDEATSIKELFIRTIKRQRSYEMFTALKDVSFKIRKGDVVGIIGTNGSGKSTILKIISGAMVPTKGTVEVDKKKIQLLTLGTGFDFELTGRENVYLNGAIIGYTREYIDEKYDDIVKFAELEGFMEEKVRNYSSGMVSRLGFAIATIRDTPEILILDEVLSVGDMFFRKKSEARIKEMIHGGSTVLIVSHSSSVIKNNCNRAVWIEKGRMRAIGNPAKVCQAYEKLQETS
ncbi:MAG: ATP-binding cassette domain-containing protein [Lachnospiraceae bacterium]